MRQMIIRVNMATSLDGKIARSERGKFRLGSELDLQRVEELREWADVIVVGAGTVRAEDPPFELRERGARERRITEGREEHPAVAVVSGSLDIGPGRIFRTPARRFVVTKEGAAGPDYALPEGTELWRIGTGRVDLKGLVRRLDAEGFARVLVEGGGGLAAGFFEHDLVDELFVTITPWLIGGDSAPGLAESGALFDPPPRFELVSMETGEEEIFLVYRKGASVELHK